MRSRTLGRRGSEHRCISRFAGRRAREPAVRLKIPCVKAVEQNAASGRIPASGRGCEAAAGALMPAAAAGGRAIRCGL